MAPEIYRSSYGPEADVWSCGIVLFMMLTAEPFFPNQEIPAEEMKRLVHDRQFVEGRVKHALQKRISSDAHDILSKMIVQDRHMRITVTEALQHPFVTNSYKTPVHDKQRLKEAHAVIGRVLDDFRTFASHSELRRAVSLLVAHMVGYDADPLEAQRLAFRMLDIYGNGELSVIALEHGLKKFNIKIPKDMDDLFHYMDTDGDGYISFLEFLSATLPLSDRSVEERYERVFKLLDADGDGFIDAEDLMRAFSCNSKDSKDNCRNALREVCPPPHRLSFKAFASLMR